MTTTGQYPPDTYRRGSALSRSFLPLALITLGVVFLLGNMIPDRGRGGLIVFGLGVAFLIGRLTTDRYGYAVPAGILLAIGSYLSLQQLTLLSGARGPALFLLLLGVGFGLVYVIGGRPAAVWPMFPAVIMIFLSLFVFGVTSLASLAAFSWIVGYWPAVLVALGLWLLFRDSLPQPVRRPLGTLGGIALLGYGALAVGSTLAAGGPMARTSLGMGFFGPPPFTDTVTLDAPISAGQTLSVSNAGGHTTIQGTGGSTVRVSAVRHVSLGGKAPDVRLNATDGGLSLAANQSRGFPFGTPNAIDYTIEVPAGVSVRAQAGSGDIDLDGLSGQVRATTGSGQIRGTGLLHLREASTGSGSITLNGVFTEAATVHAGSGTINVTLQPGTAVQLNVHTSGGSVMPQGLILSGGVTQQRTLTGALGSPIPGATLAIETGSGNVLISQ